MPETRSSAADQAAPDDLIGFLKAIPDGRYRRGVRYPQWFLLLMAAQRIRLDQHALQIQVRRAAA